MDFLVLWLKKLRVYLIYKFVDLVDIKPFLKRDPNDYCPCCGHRKGRIGAASDGKVVNCRHICEICGWIWDEPTVTVIEPEWIIATQDEQEVEGQEESELQARSGRRFIHIPPTGKEGIKVNGQELAERAPAPTKQNAKIPGASAV